MRWPLAWIGCVIVGFATGAAGRWLLAPPTLNEKPTTRENGAAHTSAAATGSRHGQKSPAALPFPRIADEVPRPSVEDLLQTPDSARSERLRRWLTSATADELARLIATAREGMLSSEDLREVHLRWAKIDPEGMIRSASNSPAAELMWRTWAAVDPDRAFAAAAASSGTIALTEVLSIIARNDPEKARRLGEAYPAVLHSRDVVTSLAYARLSEDPQGAAEMVSAYASNNTQSLVREWARSDPEAAFGWARNRPDKGERDTLLRSILRQWALSQPEKIAGVIDSLPPGETRNNLIRDQAFRLMPKDPQGALDYIDSVKNTARMPLMDKALCMLAETDPTRTLAALGQFDAGDWAAVDATSETFCVLGRSAPAATMAWLESPQGAAALASHPGFTEDVLRSWTLTQPLAAAEWLAGQPAEKRPPLCVQRIVGALVRNPEPDFEAARQWADTLPEGTHRSTAMSDVFNHWIKADPSAAAKALENTALPADARQRFTQAIGQKRTAR